MARKSLTTSLPYVFSVFLNIFQFRFLCSTSIKYCDDYIICYAHELICFLFVINKKYGIVFCQKHTTEANFEKCSSHYSFSTLGSVFFMPQFFTIYVSPKYNKKSSINKGFISSSLLRTPCL